MSRLVVLTEIIAPYRIPVFNALASEPGVDLHVIFLAETDPGLRQWAVYTDEIRFSYEVLSSRRLRLGGFHVLINSGVNRALRKSLPDAIVCGGYNYPAFWDAVMWAGRRRVPVALWTESHAHDRRRNRRLVEAAKRNYLGRCDAFLVPGTASREYLRAYGVADELIFTAPDAVDNEFFSRTSAAVRADAAAGHRPAGLPARYFLFVGRLVPEKGVFDLLEAYGTLTQELRNEIGLVFVGDGIARAKIMARATSMSSSIQVAGFAQREQLAQYYALAEALVFPTHTDPWGLVVNEAMACGLPVIASSVAGCTPDLVKDGWNGRVIRPGDVRTLAAAMENLADEDARRQMGQNSYHRIQAYTPEACAAGFVRVLQAMEKRRG